MVKPYQRIVSLACIACETCECGRCNVEDLAKRIIDDVRADGARDFAEWLVRKNGYLDLFGNDSNKLLTEWQKGREE